MTETLPTVDTAKKLGLSEEEYEQIIKILRREPNFTELSIFSVMWSEHCSYKNSIIWLKTLPREGSRLLAKAGEENAGLIDIGDGLAVAFKIESHNHPSAIEPYQGAATGVGGIHRDIFTMGARPVASLNSLRFGDLSKEKTKHLLKGVVKGIGDYGNSFGVPTVGGEIYFDECYNTNPLVNAMSVGIVEIGKTASAIAKGKGNPVFIVGSATGKDGIHGATFASEDITHTSSEKLPSVQVGDPFTEKLLLEATLEAIASGAVVGIQDMGAAGITCSTSETSAKGNSGMKIFLDKVSTRQENMKPFEIMLSESQERMLVIGEKGKENIIQKIFDKWDLNCVQIGEVTDTGRLEVFDFRNSNGQTKVADIPADVLVLGGGAPVYKREFKEPKYFEEIKKFDANKIPEPENYDEVIRFLISHPNIASKRWVRWQYDSMVGTNNSSTNQPSDAAIVRIKNSNKALALTTDCNARYVFANPETGAAIAVAESARNIVCSGGKPLAVTNCLNFGNPYNPEVYYQFVHAVKGMGNACRVFDTPVTGGNVSFYNQSSDDGPVFPTPVIGMVGLIDDLDSHRMTLDFKEAGDLIYLIGEIKNDISCSEYLYSYHKVKFSPPPHFDLQVEKKVQDTCLELIHQGLIASAHDVSDGGLICSLLESSFPRDLGFSINSPLTKGDKGGCRKDVFLFGESQGRITVSMKKENEKNFLSLLKNKNIPHLLLGEVTDGKIEIDEEKFSSVNTYKNLYLTSLENILEN